MIARRAFGRAITRRPLPLGDPSARALEPHEREALAAVWAHRAESELRVGASFAVIAQGLLEDGAEPEVLALAARAVADEVRHAEICRRVASVYRGAEVAWPAPGRIAVPAHEGASDALRRSLHVVGMCCINETLGSAFLEASLRSAKAPIARAALRELLVDEIDHGRLGWGHLAALSASAARREQIEQWLPRMLRASHRVFTSESLSPLEAGVPAHGLLPKAQSDAAIEHAIEALVLPGFARLGLRIEEWNR